MTDVTESSTDRPWLIRKGPNGSVLPNGRSTSRKGSPNKVTTLLKDAILLAGQLEGDVALQTGEVKKMYSEVDAETVKRGGLVGYLRWLARNHPQVYGSLLARAMPLQIKVDAFTQTVYSSVDEVREELVRKGVSLEAVRVLLEDGTQTSEYAVDEAGGADDAPAADGADDAG